MVIVIYEYRNYVVSSLTFVTFEFFVFHEVIIYYYINGNEILGTEYQQMYY